MCYRSLRERKDEWQSSSDSGASGDDEASAPRPIEENSELELAKRSQVDGEPGGVGDPAQSANMDSTANAGAGVDAPPPG